MTLHKSSTLHIAGLVVFLIALPQPMALAAADMPGVQVNGAKDAGLKFAGAEQTELPGAAAAFDSAKELGTADAWNAFLANYPTGFHADLARAYVKKLTELAPAGAAAALAPTGIAHELACSERGKLFSKNSDVPTKVTFVNNSGMQRSIQWIDFKGDLKDYGGLNPGAQITLDTFVTHPWMVATGPGDCLQIFMPDPQPAIIELLRLAEDDQRSKPAARGELPAKKKVVREEREDKYEQKPKKKPLVCGQNYKLRNGECVLIQNCGANAYRSPEGDCYCTKNYKMTNGKCVWKTDKQGFEVAPWKKTGCKTWQSQCSAGNNKACGQYEANCQVN